MRIIRTGTASCSTSVVGTERRLFRTLAVFLLLLGAVQAQESTPQRPRIGLALSGGGAKGIAHIGVLKVLTEAGLPIDMIAGTSMGAIVGGMYAIGYSPEAIEAIVSELDWQHIITDMRHRKLQPMAEKRFDSRYIGSFVIKNGHLRLPAGLKAGQNVAELLLRLTWPAHHIQEFRELPVPFVCVATDLASGEAVALERGFLPEALRASMAIPTLFNPVRMDDRLLVDGGLTRNLPAEDVIRLGADIVIGVDVGTSLRSADELTSLVEILDQAISLKSVLTTEKQRKLCDLLITPELGGLSFSDYDKAQQLIEVGRQAALAVLPEIRALIDSLKIPRPQPVAFPRKDPIFVQELHIDGVEQVSPKVIRSEIGLELPGYVTSEDLEHGIERLYSLQFFETISYTFRPLPGGGRQLRIKVKERFANLFRFGLRYDSENKATLLFNTTIRNRTGKSSALLIDVQLAGKTRLEGEYYAHSGLRSGLGVRIHALYESVPLDIYSGARRTARLKRQSLMGDFSIGTIYSNSLAMSVGVNLERYLLSPDIAPPEYGETGKHITFLYSMLQLDTIDRTVFPTAGHWLRLRTEYSHAKLGSQTAFWRTWLDWRGYLAVDDKLTVLGNLFIGAMRQTELPLHYNFFLGDTELFTGFHPQQLRGPAVQAIQVGFQYEWQFQRFIILRMNTGNTFARWPWNIHKQRYESGVGLTLGAATPIGPVEFTAMSSSLNRFLTYVSIGFKF